MTGVAGLSRRERRLAVRHARRLLAMAVVCMLSGFLPLMVILVLQGVNAGRQSVEAVQVEDEQAAWSDGRKTLMLEQAQAYNRRLAENGQPAIGSLPDPTTGEADFAARADSEYWSLLSGTQDIMGTVRIPRIGVTLPIRHGSDESALGNGAGHLYGTSLPVGGESTHTVITAHRGVPDKELFTRLDELEEGDVFYLTVLDTTLAYRVTSVRETDPQDVSMVRIVEGEDLATLLTCTPYGVNTRRLLVTGKRASMPDDAPDVQDAPKDGKPVMVGVLVGLLVLVTGLMLVPCGRTVVGSHINRTR